MLKLDGKDICTHNEIICKSTCSFYDASTSAQSSLFSRSVINIKNTPKCKQNTHLLLYRFSQ